MIDIAGKLAALLSNKVRTAVATIDLDQAAGTLSFRAQGQGGSVVANYSCWFDEVEVYS